MSITASSFVLKDNQGNSVTMVDGAGSYSMEFTFKDIAGNGLDGVILNLTITV
jgi:hypothetical protein